MLSGLERESLDASRASEKCDWETARVTELFYVKGRIGWRGLRRSDFTVEGPFLITGMHIEAGRVQWEQCFHIPESRLNESPEIIVQQDDMVVTKDGTIGKVAYIDFLPGPTSLNSHLFLVRPKVTRVDRRFAYHVFTSFLFQRFIEQQSSGSTLTGLPESRFLNFVLPLPPLCEQLRIAAVLDTVDEAIAKTEAVIAKLRKVLAGLLHDLLTRGLDEHGQIRDPIAHPEQFKDSPLGRIPLEWEIERLGGRIRVQGGFAFHSSDFVARGIPLVRIGNITEQGIDLSEAMCLPDRIAAAAQEFVIKEGDVLIAMSGATTGKVTIASSADVPSLLSQRVGRFCPINSDAAWMPFIFALTKTPLFQKHVSVDSLGGAQPNVSAVEIESFQMAWPPFNEQVSIANILAAQDTRIHAEQAFLVKLSSLKSGLMADLLTGRVRVQESVSAVENQP